MASNGIINPNQIQHEIEILKSQKQEIEARISLLQSQLHQQQQYSSCINESCPPISSVQGRREDDKKPGDDQAAYINLKVLGQVCNVETEVVFRMKRSTKLKNLMNAYCDRRSVGFTSIEFSFNGRRLRENPTPDEMQMEDGDEIDAWLNLPLKD